MGATIYAVSAYFPRHDPFIRAARLERRRRYLSAHRARRHRPDHQLRDGVRRPLAAMSRTAVTAARRARHVDRMDTPARSRSGFRAGGRAGGIRLVAETASREHRAVQSREGWLSRGWPDDR